MGVDEILVNFEEPEVLKKYFIGGMCGYDKLGLPIRIEPFGGLDMRGIMKSVKKTDLEKVVIRNCEELAQECKYQSEIHQRRIDGFTLIFDMTNFNKKMLWKPGLNLYIHNAEILQNNYPGLQKRMFIVNAPAIFPILWKVAKPIINKDVRKKIKVLGRDYKQELLKYIDKDQLPAYLGGSMTGPNGDQLCLHKICHGGEVPSEYFIDEAIQTKYMEVITVNAGNELKIECKIPSPGSVLSWSFKTEENSIGFGITMKTMTDTRERVVMARSKVDSHILEQDGSIVCEKEGKCEYYTSC
ncbi:retinal-binding protein-like [Watersipora subatra]|uniref:retinal-binding protein-like n=1 Tax=Watersipora subatra TaxID=2589382 RepID=UPI00355BCAFB